MALFDALRRRHGPLDALRKTTWPSRWPVASRTLGVVQRPGVACVGEARQGAVERRTRRGAISRAGARGAGDDQWEDGSEDADAARQICPAWPTQRRITGQKSRNDATEGATAETSGLSSRRGPKARRRGRRVSRRAAARRRPGRRSRSHRRDRRRWRPARPGRRRAVVGRRGRDRGVECSTMSRRSTAAFRSPRSSLELKGAGAAAVTPHLLAPAPRRRLEPPKHAREEARRGSRAGGRGGPARARTRSLVADRPPAAGLPHLLGPRRPVVGRTRAKESDCRAARARTRSLALKSSR